MSARGMSDAVCVVRVACWMRSRRNQRICWRKRQYATRCQCPANQASNWGSTWREVTFSALQHAGFFGYNLVTSDL